MSNILIIKHGSLGDLIQANGAIRDIRENFPNDKILILTTQPYVPFMSRCPYIDGVLIDKRLPRWNLFYLIKLNRMLKRFSFEKVFDLQNSSRTRFYRRFFFKNIEWSSTDTTLGKNEKKSDFDKSPVLERMKIQLEKSGLKIKFTKSPDLKWAIINMTSLTNQYFEGNYILIFPFCSPKHKKKIWPYFYDLILYLKKNFENRYNIVIAPGPGEIEEAKKLPVNIVLDNGKPISISQLISLINDSSYVISNDTGPAHISAHLNKKGLVLFGGHTSPEKVSIETENFKSLQSKDLKELRISSVIELLKSNLN